jgi:hypothetical protein
MKDAGRLEACNAPTVQIHARNEIRGRRVKTFHYPVFDGPDDCFA